MKKQAEREDGQLLILSPKDGSAAALSALPSNAASEGKSNEKSTEKKVEGEDISFRFGPSGKTLGEQSTGPRAAATKSVAADPRDKFGIEAEVIDTPEDVQNAEARKRIKAGNAVKGWYDKKTGKVVIYSPNIESEQDAMATYAHEVVGHKGMEGLLGKERYDRLCEKLGAVLTPEQRERVAEYEGSSERTLGDEYIARVAEELIDAEGNIKEPTTWAKVKGAVREFFRDALGLNLTDADIKYLLWKSAERLRHGKTDLTQAARDVLTERGLKEWATRMRRGEADYQREVRQIEECAKADGTYMQAPNGKATNLDERQWAHVRSSRFKQWFGDWELGTKVVNVVKGNMNHGFKSFAEARAWAKSLEGISRLYTDRETGGKGNINISKGTVDKFLQQNAVEKSEDKDAHLAVLRVLGDVLRESIDAEQHPDYKKGADGVRRPENGINPNVTIHRLYGAVNIEGKTYRVKITVKEDGTSRAPMKAHSYEATKIELQAGTLGNSEDGLSPDTNNSISRVKLLGDVEKSYSNGEKLLDSISKVVDENGEPLVVYHGAPMFGFTVFDKEI